MFGVYKYNIIYKTALDYAKEKDHPKIVEFLMKGVKQIANTKNSKTQATKQESKNMITTTSQNKEEKIR